MIRRILLGLLALLFVPILLLVPPANSASAATRVQAKSFERSISIQASPGHRLDSAATRAVYRDMKTDGANTVTLTFPLYQETVKSTVITTRDNNADHVGTPSDAELGAAIDAARADGLNVDVKPQLALPGNAWRSRITFSNSENKAADAWAASWRAWMVHYAKIAQAHHAHMLVVGTEQIGVTLDHADKNKGIDHPEQWKANRHNTDRWIATVKAVRKVYKGRVTYAAYRGSYNRPKESVLLSPRFTRLLDEVDLTYYQHDYSAHPTVAGNRAAFESDRKTYFDKMWSRYHKPIGIAETGYEGADAQAQTYWYEAFSGFINSSKSKHIIDVSVFRWNDTRSPGGWSTQTLPAEAVQAALYGGKVAQ